MPEINFNNLLIAAGYDANKNRKVSDELKVEHKAVDTNGDGDVSVEELAAALASDKVEVTAGSIVAAKSRSYHDIVDVFRMQQANEAARSGTGIGSSSEPFYPYTKTINHADGTSESVPDWQRATDKMHFDLVRVRDSVRGSNDPTLKTVGKQAEKAIWDYTIGSWFATKGPQATYTYLYAQLDAIKGMTADAPAQPKAAIASANNVITAARSELEFIGGVVNDKAKLQTLIGAAERKIAEERGKGGIGGWFSKRRASGLEGKLATLKAANPAEQTAALAGSARRLYELSLEASGASTLSEAQHIDAGSAKIRGEAESIRRNASATAEAIRDLQKAVSK